MNTLIFRQFILQSVLILVITLFSLNRINSQCAVDFIYTNYFCDLDSVVVTAIPVSGAPPFSFIWETGETTQSILVPMAMGDYMLTMTDANGCTSIINCHVKPIGSGLLYPYTPHACEGDTVNLFLQWWGDSIPGATYLWSTGDTTPSIWITDDIVWSVTITDPSNGCEFIIPPSLFDFHPTPWPQIVGPDELCEGQTITLSVTGGPFGVVIWYPEGFFGNTYDVTEPGTYIVHATSPEVSYCAHQDTITITQINLLPILTGPQELCPGQSGNINITNYTLFENFIWNNGTTDPSLAINSPGVYSVTVTDLGGCTGSAGFTVNAGTGPTLSAEVTGTTCGENNGSIDLSPLPLQSYIYNWSNGANTQDLVNITAGNYSVTVTDLNGCTATINIAVPNNPISIVLNANVTPNTNCVNFNGAIDLSVAPANEPYTYSWSNGVNTQDLTNVAAGSYTVTVTTGVNCIATATFIVNDNSAAPEIISTTVPSTCGQNNGSASVQLQGGQGPFTYIWSNGNTTESITNVIAGNYTVTVTGANGCINSESVLIENIDPVITISGNVIPNTSCNQSNGEIDITVSPSGSYSFNWSNGSTSEDLIDLGAGTYTLTVTLGATCIQTESFTVPNQNIPFDIQGITTPNTSCTIPNGIIDISIIPNGSYAIEWSNGQTTEDLFNLDTGNYSVTVTDLTGCHISSTFTVENLFPSIIVSGLTVANSSCQIPNGMIDISVSPSSNYSFLWSNGAITEDLLNITGGNYSVTITNEDGCTIDTFFTVNEQSSSFSLSGIPADNNSCISPNGSVDLTVNPPGTYTFLWSNGMTNEDLNALNGGIYSVTVSDNNGCSSVTTFTILNNTVNPTLSAILSNEICGAADGSIDLTINPVGSSVIWSTGATTEDLLNLAAGQYYVTVTSPSSCTISDTFNLSNTSNNFSISGSPSDNYSCINPNGSIDITINPTGTYSFTWSNGSNTEDILNLSSGTYVVTVTDDINCTSSATFTISSITIEPVISSNISPASCGNANGSINLDVIPSTGNTYLWSNGITTEELNNLQSGTYYVTVTSSNGCTATASIIVPDNNSNFILSASSVDNNSCNTPSGSIDLNVSPSGIYNFLWSNGLITEDIQNLTAGDYTVSVTDLFGCTSSASFTVLANLVFPVLNLIATPANCGQNNGSIDLTVTNTSNNSFLWSNGSQTEDLSNISPGTYDVTVTAPTGCYSIGVINVPIQNSNFSIGSVIIDDNSCIIPNGAIDLTVTPLGQYLFSWSNGQTAEDLLNLSSGIYTVTVTDQFGCFSTETFSVENVSIPVLVAEIIKEPTCGQSNGSIFLEVNPATGNTFLWSNGETGKDLNNVPSGNYSVIVTNVNGCTFTGNYLISDSEPIILDLEADLSSINVDGTVTCNLVLNVPMETIDSIFWSPVEIMSCHDILCLSQTFTLPGQTEVIVMAMDTNGCMGIARLMLDIEKESDVFIPNVFSPNGDDRNDMFTVFANEEVEQVVILEIFDRWGNLLFINETFPPNEPGFGWDGSFKGQMMNPDVFAYWAVVRYSNNEEHLFKGDVTLLR